MKRCEIIGLMSASLDGKITGDFMDTPAGQHSGEIYEDINAQIQAQAWINGRVTMDENFTFYEKPMLKTPKCRIPIEDYVACSQQENYIVALDPSGSLGWKKNYVQYANRPKAHVIEILCETVSQDYLSFLRQQKISYLFAGEKEVDLNLVVQKLYDVFGIERCKVSGGGVLNWSFIDAGLMDTFHLVLVPAVDGDPKTPSLFRRMERMDYHGPISFSLKDVKTFEDGCLWLQYELKGKEDEKKTDS